MTKVANLYHVGRVRTARQPFEFIALRGQRLEALALAWRTAGTRHRVFLYPTAGGPDYIEMVAPPFPGDDAWTDVHAD